MVGQREILHPADVANEIGANLAERCRSGNRDERFLRKKDRCEARALDFSTSADVSYNEIFTLVELRAAIGSLRSVCEGPDGVHNEMLAHLSLFAQEVLLNSFNTLWVRGEFPEAWREAIVVPILKPGKSGLDPTD